MRDNGGVGPYLGALCNLLGPKGFGLGLLRFLGLPRLGRVRPGYRDG